MRVPLLFFLIITACLLLIYSSTLSIDFAQNDDYYYFAYDTRATFKAHPQYIFFDLVGRQLYNIIAFPVAKLIRGMDDFALVRTLEIIFLAMSGALVAWYATTLGVSNRRAVVLALLLTTLPGFQAGILWVTMGPFYVAFLLGLVGGVVVQSVNTAMPIFSGHNLTRLLIGSVVFLAALFIYQPWAMSFLLPVVAYLLFQSGVSAGHKIFVLIINGVVFSISAILYFSIHNFIYLPYIFAVNPVRRSQFEALGNLRFELSDDPVGRLLNLLEHAGVEIIGLWDIYGSGWGMWITLIILATGLTAAGLRVLHTAVRPSICLAHGMFVAAGCIGILLASAIPLYASAGGHAGFRVLLPTSAIFVLLIVWAAGSIVDAIPELLVKKRFLALRSFFLQSLQIIIFGGFLVLAGATAYKNTRDSATNNAAEYSYLQSVLLNHINNFGVPSHIHFIRPRGNISYLGLPTLGNGEFNFKSAANWPNVLWMLRASLLPFFADRNDVKVILGYRATPEQYLPGFITVTQGDMPPASADSRGTVIIDMNARIRPESLFKRADIMTDLHVETSSSTASHPIILAFDGSKAPDDFWEAANFPIVVNLLFREPKELFSYSFSTGESGGRMPRSWQVFGVDNEMNEDMIDSRFLDKSWEPHETRKFILGNPSRYSRYRIVFSEGFSEDILRIYEIQFSAK